MNGSGNSLSEWLALWLGRASRETFANAKETVRAIEELQREQMRLAGELESLLAAYDKKSRKLSARLARAMLGGDVSPAELAKLAEEQEALWRLIRRGQAAGRSTRALEQELREWCSRSDAYVGKHHPDHPEQRREFVASELRSRGRDPEAFMEYMRRPFEGSARDVDGLEDAMMSQKDGNGVTLSDSMMPVENAHVVWDTEGSEDAILREIAYCRREIRRLLAHPDSRHLGGELASFHAQLKDLHAHLRLQDRKHGERRHRFVIGV